MSTAAYDDSFIAEALPAFVSEAHEQLAELENLLLQLEEAPQDRGMLDALFRCAHTVKGSAGIFGLEDVVAFTHHVETLLDRLREGQVMFTPSLGTLLLQAKDEMRALIHMAEGAAEEDGGEQKRAAVEARICAACGVTSVDDSQSSVQRAAAREGTAKWSVIARFAKDTFRNGLDPLALLNYLQGLGTISALSLDATQIPEIDQLDPESCHVSVQFAIEMAGARESLEDAFSFVRDDCELTIEPAISNESVVATVEAKTAETSISIKPASASAAPVAATEETRFIRVQADRLDAVINLLGELVIAGAGASLMARRSGQGALIEANQQVIRLVEEIRNSTLQLRMVPIGESFVRFRRVVRDTASELGKEVALELEGADTELDKSVVEKIADPLMHLVRNALDHGLEGPEERVAGGKSAQGKLMLSACHESGNILIRITDDGRGINRDRVLQRAWQRGLVPEGVVPPDADILNLIFEPGFSTAEKVTNLSGRGVGMDVVRRNIEALRGSVGITSDFGHGTTISIRLPLTLAIIDGFLVGVGASRFIFPLDAVVEVIEGAVSDATAISGCIEVRGTLLPVLNLRAAYSLGGSNAHRGSVVVIRAGARRFGVLVDTLLGQHQTVIKPLGKMLRSLRGISGSSILGNGEVALIFDAASLGQMAAQGGNSFAVTPAHAAIASSNT